MALVWLLLLVVVVTLLRWPAVLVVRLSPLPLLPLLVLPPLAAAAAVAGE
jgi:hypothetical protein